jgi:hypothetical protein
MSTQTESNQDHTITYVDSPMTKVTLSNGQLKVLTNSDALAQAIKLWVVSGKNEKVRSNSGGWVVPYIGKPLDDDTAEKIRKGILTGLETDFSPKLTIVDLQVIPDKTKQRWVIYVVGYSADLNVGVNTYMTVNGTPS